MTSVVIDDHLLRDILVAARPADLGGLVTGGLATTGLWLFRLASSFADPTITGKLSRPVASLPAEMQAQFRAQLTAIPPDIEVLSLGTVSWCRAETTYVNNVPYQGNYGTAISTYQGNFATFPCDASGKMVATPSRVPVFVGPAVAGIAAWSEVDKVVGATVIK